MKTDFLFAGEYDNTETPYEDAWKDFTIEVNIHRKDLISLLSKFSLNYAIKVSGKMSFSITYIDSYYITRQYHGNIQFFETNDSICTSIFNGIHTMLLSYYSNSENILKQKMKDLSEISGINYYGFKRLTNPEIDPYDEEDWGWEQIDESLNHDPLNIKKFKIAYRNFDEVVKIVEFLTEYGYTFFNKQGIYTEYINWSCFCPNNKDDRYDFVLCNGTHFHNLNMETLNVDDLLSRSGQKFKKITNSEIDPYDEEDWGWEQIDEDYEEKVNDPKFDIGDIVTVNGEVGMSNFIDVTGTITKKKQGSLYYYHNIYSRNRFNNDVDNMYYGIVYYIDSIKYWVPPYVLKKNDETQDSYPKIKWYNKGKWVNENIKYKDLYIGQRVKYNSGDILNGLHGKIQSFDNDGVCVEFDENIKNLFGIGHNGDGRGKDGHCFWVFSERLIPVKEEVSKIKWYNKGKWVNEGLEYDLNIGQRVKYNNSDDILNGLHGKIQSFDNNAVCIEFDENIRNLFGIGHNGDGRGKNGHCYWVSPDNLIPEKEEVSKIKWYNKGKWVNEGLEYDLNIGQRVKYEDGSKFCLNGYSGKILTIDISTVCVEFDENIRDLFGFGHNCNGRGKNGHCYWISEKSLVLEEEIAPNIKWYKKGKWINENIDYDDLYIGQRVKYIVDPIYYKCNGFNYKLNDLLGTIIAKNYYDEIGVEFDENIRDLFKFGHDCTGSGKKGHCYWISPKLLVPEEEIVPKIKWYKKGKWVNENANISDFQIGQRVKYQIDLIKGEFRTGYRPELNNFRGKILSVNEFGDIGVEFDENILDLFRFGHDCDSYGANKGKNGHCYWISPIYLEPEEEVVPKIKWYKKGKWVNENANISDFQIGQRVKYVFDPDKTGAGHSPKLNNFRGTIISKSGDDFGVEFDENIAGHNCYGKGKEGHCYWISPIYLEPEEEVVPKIKWYKKGKWSNESKLHNYKDFI